MAGYLPEGILPKKSGFGLRDMIAHRGIPGVSGVTDARSGQRLTQGAADARGPYMTRWAPTSGVGPGTAGYRGSWRPGGYNFGQGTRGPSARSADEWYAQRDEAVGNPLDNLFWTGPGGKSLIEAAANEANGKAAPGPAPWDKPAASTGDVWKQTESGKRPFSPIATTPTSAAPDVWAATESKGNNWGYADSQAPDAIASGIAYNGGLYDDVPEVQDTGLPGIPDVGPGELPVSNTHWFPPKMQLPHSPNEMVSNALTGASSALHKTGQNMRDWAVTNNPAWWPSRIKSWWNTPAY